MPTVTAEAFERTEQPAPARPRRRRRAVDVGAAPVVVGLVGMMVVCGGLVGFLGSLSGLNSYQYERFRDDNAIGATANAMETVNDMLGLVVAVGVLIVGLLCIQLAHLIQLDHALRQWWDYREEDREDAN